LVGIEFPLGAEVGLQHAMVQVEGQALRIEARKLEAAIEDDTAALRLHLAR
jgi:hypothetical protein